MILAPIPSPCRLTQRFGANAVNYEQYGLKGHDGTDFASPVPGASVPTYSPYDGTVSIMTGKSGWTAYGNCVVIHTPQDNQGISRQIVLGHHFDIFVKDGQWVHMGDKIGMMGDTGAATGIHVHLGVRYLLEDGEVRDFNNGYHGWQNVEEYILYWKLDPTGMVTFPS